MANSWRKYVNTWNGRLRAPMVEYIILFEGAYSPKEAYPYAIAKFCESEWGENAVPLTTIYSAITRLDKANLIRVRGEIVNGRVQKLISTLPDGFEVLKELQNTMSYQCEWFRKFQEAKVN